MVLYATSASSCPSSVRWYRGSACEFIPQPMIPTLARLPCYWTVSARLGRPKTALLDWQRIARYNDKKQRKERSLRAACLGGPASQWPHGMCHVYCIKLRGRFQPFRRMEMPWRRISCLSRVPVSHEVPGYSSAAHPPGRWSEAVGTNLHPVPLGSW